MRHPIIKDRDSLQEDPMASLDKINPLPTPPLCFALTEPIHLPSARAKGLPIVAVGKYFETGFGIMTVGRDINSLKDLKGRTIAVSLETHAPLIMKAMLHHDSGLALSENDLKFTDAGYYLVDPLLEKKEKS
jgi:hypothetical protein